MSTMMSVSSLNTKIKSLLEATFMHTMVEGEVASLTYHSSGHLYFSIKDKDSSIKCVMWRSSVARMKFRIEKGMHIVVEGSVSVYAPRGEYQFQTTRIEPYGQGTLAIAYEQLKKKLKDKGYFKLERKKPIPKHIRTLALVTAKDSAALHDMIKIIKKRWSMVKVTIVDTLVQGEQAAQQISNSIKYADSLNVDIIVLSRGGGSTEDLWSFNEEVVADSIFQAQTPIVSAIGHEVDILISDLVADLRAPTPSSAIEMILPDSQEILHTLSDIEDQFSHLITHNIQRISQDLKHVEEMLTYTSPLKKLENTKHSFDAQYKEFSHAIDYKIANLMNVFAPQISKLNYTLTMRVQEKQNNVNLLEEKMKLNNPKLPYKPGWGSVSIDGKITDLSSINIDDIFILEGKDVKIKALCLEKNPYKK